MPEYFKSRRGIVRIDINDPAFIARTQNGWSVWVEHREGEPRQELRYLKRENKWVTPLEFATLSGPRVLSHISTFAARTENVRHAGGLWKGWPF